MEKYFPKKRSHSDSSDADDSPAKKVAKQPSVEPLVPTQDPCSKDYDLAASARWNKNKADGQQAVKWVIYLAVREPGDSKFARCIRKCQSMASSNLKPRLQMAGTRHVTLWEGLLTPQQASQIGFNHDDDNVEFLPMPVRFDSWIPRGGYLRLDAATQSNLKEMVGELLNLPTHSKSKVICDHLSLYRCRGMNYQTFNQDCAKIRNGVPASEWGMVEGVSIRLKVIGSEYSHCRVLAGV